MRTGNLKGKLWHPNPERLGGFIHFHLLQREGAGSVDRKRFSSNLRVHSLSASWDSQGQGQETTNLIWIPHMSDRTLNHCFPGHTDRKRSHVEWHCHRGHRQLNLLTTKPTQQPALPLQALQADTQETESRSSNEDPKVSFLPSSQATVLPPEQQTQLLLWTSKAARLNS